MIYGCGNNISNQLCSVAPKVICCPTQVDSLTETNDAHITFSHILWRTGTTWKLTGYKSNDAPPYDVIHPKWKVTICENRTAAITECGSVVIWDKRRFWRKLFFQNSIQSGIENCDPHNENPLEPTLVPSLLEPSFSNEISSNSPQGENKKINSKCGLHRNTEQGRFVRNPGEISSSIQESDTLGNTEKSGAYKNTDFCESDQMFKKICVEDNALLALDKDNVIYNCDIPVIVCRQRITEISLGKEHYMALTCGGSVYTWGSGMRGQLGNGELGYCDSPIHVENLEGLIITSISCGGWHSTALSETGDVYAWGWNESGQLGFPFKTKNESSVCGSLEHSCQCPQPVHHKPHFQSSITNTNEEKQDATDFCLPSVAETGDITKECDRVRQLDVDKRINQERVDETLNVQASPKLLNFWNENMSITEVACGDRHTLFHIDDGSVWAVGMNKYGQLGLGHTRSISEPAEIPIKNVTKLYAGGWNSIFVTSH